LPGFIISLHVFYLCLLSVIVSKWSLATITEDGVWFLSPHDGTPMQLMPEASISLQNSTGSDTTACKSGELQSM